MLRIVITLPVLEEASKSCIRKRPLDHLQQDIERYGGDVISRFCCGYTVKRVTNASIHNQDVEFMLHEEVYHIGYHLNAFVADIAQPAHKGG